MIDAIRASSCITCFMFFQLFAHTIVKYSTAEECLLSLSKRRYLPVGKTSAIKQITTEGPACMAAASHDGWLAITLTSARISTTAAGHAQTRAPAKHEAEQSVSAGISPIRPGARTAFCSFKRPALMSAPVKAPFHGRTNSEAIRSRGIAATVHTNERARRAI